MPVNDKGRAELPATSYRIYSLAAGRDLDDPNLRLSAAFGGTAHLTSTASVGTRTATVPQPGTNHGADG